MRSLKREPVAMGEGEAEQLLVKKKKKIEKKGIGKRKKERLSQVKKKKL